MTERDFDTPPLFTLDAPPVGRRQAMALIAGAAAAAALPVAAHAQGQPRRGGVLRVSVPANPSTMDPIAGRSGYDHPMLYPMFDTLVDWDYETLSAKPGLARSWKFTDAKTLVMDLEPNVTFHDGTPMDAAAVKFNLDRGRNDPRSNIKPDLASVASVEVTGPLQVTLRLRQPDTALVLILSDRAGMMVSPKAVQTLGAGIDRTAVGAGAWKFSNWTDNEKLVVVRNEKYWRPNRPHLDGISFAIIPEVNTGLRSVVSGQNDLVYSLSPTQLPVIERAKKLRAVSNTTLFVHMFYLNMGRAPLNDVRVRRAMNFAIDRDAFNKVTQAGIGEPAMTLLPKAHWAYDRSLDNVYRYDPDHARKLLAEAGYKDGCDLNIVGWTDQRSLQRQELLMAQMAKAGFRLRFQNASAVDATAQFTGPDQKGDAYLAAFTGRPDPSLIFQTVLAKDSFLNPGKADPAPGRAEAQAESQAVEDVGERKKALAKLQRIVAEHALLVPIVVQYDVQAMTEQVHGYQPNLLGKPKFDGVWMAS